MMAGRTGGFVCFEVLGRDLEIQMRNVGGKGVRETRVACKTVLYRPRLALIIILESNVLG